MVKRFLTGPAGVWLLSAAACALIWILTPVLTPLILKYVLGLG